MKTKTTYFLGIMATVLAVTILLFGCRNKEIDAAAFSISHEKVRLAADSVTLSGTYDFPAEAKSMEINVGLEEDLSDAAVHHVHLLGKDYSVTIHNLQPSTTYYYCYTADFGLKTDYETETMNFTTKEVSSYQISVSSEPTIGGMVTGGGSYEAGHTCTVKAIPAEGYVFSFWKENEIPLTQETSYAFTVNGSRMLVARFAEIALLPVVVTGEMTGMTGTTAFGSGEVVGEGGSEVTERGVCWALHHTPKTGDNHAGNGAGMGAFTAEMTGLIPDTTYYVRAYAVNSEGTAYGEEKSFVSTPAEYHVTVSANPTNGGMVTGGGTFQAGQTCMVKATVNEGYTFVNWTENGNQVSTNTDYSFTVSGDRSLVANFTAASYVISASVDPEDSGTITGAGGYENGQSCTLTATANTGYTFEKWTENGSQVSTNATYTFNVTASRTLVAHFKAQEYTVNVSAQPSSGGVVSGGGTYTYGQSCTVNATANEGYDFTNWTENGGVVSTDASYSFTVNSNRNLVANFTQQAPQNYTISVSANPSSGGTVTGGGTYQEGQTCTVSATASSGYDFTNWTENGSVVSSNASYSFTVNSNRNLVANFTQQAPQNYTITVSANPSEGGTVTGGGTYQQGESCTVSATPSSASSFSYNFENGSLSGWTLIDADGDGYNWRLGSNMNMQGLGHNSSSDFVLSQSYDNYYGALVPDNYLVSEQVGVSVGSTFSFYACAQDNSYSAEHFGVAVSTTGNTNPNNFTMVQEWTMTAKGMRSPLSVMSRSRDQGTWRQYTVDLSAYAGQQVYIAIRHFNCSDQFCLDVDDIELTGVGAFSFVNWTENGSVVSTNASYTFTVTGNRTLVANFSQQAAQNYTISVSANPSNGGSVTGGGTYQQGQSCTVTATANTGYTFTNWTENGNVVSTNANYAFTVTGNRTLVANFTQQAPQYFTIAVSANPSAGGSVSGGGNYQQGQSCTVTATANTGYTFTNWTENGDVVSTNANYTFTVTENRVLVAHFTANPQNYTITVSANPSNGGSVSGGGTYQQGQSCTVSASANSGFAFTNWIENGNVVSTNDNYTFTVNNDRTLVANFSEIPIWPNGVLPGLFSVSATQQVRFSQGNLQYRASSNTWRFAINQWDYCGGTLNGVFYGNVGNGSNDNPSSTNSNWIDLFGWGTSGYNHGAVCYQPWSFGSNNDFWAYGDYIYHLFDQTGKADWGYNAISNGGNVEDVWRTLDRSEWNYILFNRYTSSNIRYAKANVNGVNGLILLPDNWSASYYSLNNTNQSDASFNSNEIIASDWINNLEEHGAVFLPAAGERSGSSLVGDTPVCWVGVYWTSNRDPEGNTIEGNACYMEFTEYGQSMVYTLNGCSRHAGNSVRLVQNY